MARRGKVRQVVDWGAAIKAGFLAGLVFLLVNLFLTQYVLPDLKPKRICQYFASVLLGPQAFEEAPAPPPGFQEAPPPKSISGQILEHSPQEWRIYASMLLTHFASAFLATFVLAIIVHEGGKLRGFFMGAVFGACVYVINMYAMTKFAPMLFSLHHWFFLASHVLFGALAGLLYEIFEREIYLDERGRVVGSEEVSPT